ncbi:hypothetical protein ACODT3_42185 [Streptomyces sp. 4.24]
MPDVACELGVSTEGLRGWVKQYDTPASVMCHLRFCRQ